MSTDQLRNLRELPTTMMWRGVYDPTIQYIKNDIVIASDNAAYICISTIVVLGQDPITSLDWFLFTGTVSYIHTIKLNGITNSGSSTQPILNNAGVNKITAGNRITLGGTAQNRIINSTALSGLIEGLGISIVGSEITNTGIRSIGVGGGLYLESPPPNVKISMSNVLSVTVGNGIENSGTAQNPIIENMYVRSASLTDITNTGTPNDLILTSPSVQTIANIDGSVQIMGLFDTRVLSCIQVPLLLKICAGSTITPVGWPAVGQGSGNLNFLCISEIINRSLEFGAPATMYVNLSSVCVRIGGAGPLVNAKGKISAVDSTTGTIINVGLIGTPQTSFASYPFDMSFGTVIMDITVLRAQGMRALTGFNFQPASPNQSYSLLAFGDINVVWVQQP